MNLRIAKILTLVLIILILAQFDPINCGKKRNEEIIVINNTGGGGCGGGAKTIVKTDGNKKKSSGHKIILMAGGNGKCHEKHHHTKVVHVPVPVPVPVPVKHEVHHEHQDYWGKQESHHDDHYASASSNQAKKHKFVKSGEMVKSSSVPYHLSNFNVGSMMPRMENHRDPKSNIMQTLLVPNVDKNINSRTEKKSKQNSTNSKDKKKSNFDKNETNDYQYNSIDTVNLLSQPIMTPLLVETMPTIINPNFLPTMSINTNQFSQSNPVELAQQLNEQMHFQQQNLEQNKKMHEIHHHMQNHLEQQLNNHLHHLQNQHINEKFHQQKLQEAMSSTIPHQIPNDSPLVAQLPIPLPGQIISAPVFEPIDFQLNDENKNNNLQEQNFPQYINSNDQISNIIPFTNKLEIIPYEVQQQLHHDALNEKFINFNNEPLKDISFKNQKESKKNNENQQNKELDVSSSNLVFKKELPLVNYLNTLHENQPNNLMFPTRQSNQILHSFINNNPPEQTVSSFSVPTLVSQEQFFNGQKVNNYSEFRTV